MLLSSAESLNIASWFVHRHAESDPERIAIVDDSTVHTYSDVSVLITCVANGLREFGCRPGDRVLVAVPDSIEFVASFFGAAQIGCLPVPVNPLAHTNEFRYYIEDCSPRVAIVHSSTPNHVLSEPNHRLIRVVVGTGGQSDASWHSWISNTSGTRTSIVTNDNKSGFILYTSGSTGRPKGVFHAGRSMVAASSNFASGVLRMTCDDRTFSISKLSFAYGLGNAMYFPFSVGASTVLNPERLSLQKTSAVMAAHKPTIFFGVPSFFRTLLRESNTGLSIDFSSIRVMVSAAEPLPASVLRAFQDRYGLEILDGLGSTEMLQTFISNRPARVRPETCGEAVPNYEISVREKDNPVADGTIGSLWVKGDTSFVEYWNDVAGTAMKKREGWVITGDKVFKDSDGYFHYCGREDDMFKIRGLWVSPHRIEALLNDHPHLDGAAVVGRESVEGGRELIAYVVATQHDVSLERDLRRYLQSHLPEHMLPARFVRVPELPLNSNGKVDRSALGSSTDKDLTQGGDFLGALPRTDTERMLVEMWASLLAIEKIGIDDNFIDLGGDSVTAMQCLNRINDAFGIDLSLEIFFQEGSIRPIAALVDEQRRTNGS